MIYLTIICVMLALLCGFVFWMWREDKKHCHAIKTEEAVRLYRFIDGMLDRIDSDSIEQYAFTHRIKHDIAVQAMNVPSKEPSDEKEPPKFVHQKR